MTGNNVPAHDCASCPGTWQCLVSGYMPPESRRADSSDMPQHKALSDGLKELWLDMDWKNKGTINDKGPPICDRRPLRAQHLSAALMPVCQIS